MWILKSLYKEGERLSKQTVQRKGIVTVLILLNLESNIILIVKTERNRNEVKDISESTLLYKNSGHQ